MKCICEWPPTCSGAAILHCRNFGDCYCPCGCEAECYGCARCDSYDDEDLADSDEEHVP